MSDKAKATSTQRAQRTRAMRALEQAGRKIRAAKEAQVNASAQGRKAAEMLKALVGTSAEISVQDAARILGVSRMTVYTWTGIGRQEDKPQEPGQAPEQAEQGAA
jgi:DNA invertase Pin-like site-specific DNA recombinase